ncbi:EF-hand calcium-binding domain-containing protein 6-like isoform X1 [Branchiostoma lanceolatum]|uniref:EF-hand calcium-binding domain-containing protein 6-like isoform X1 n=2 Tax=Branchiostoma lanceolatum TaxID=7740 RepID=UPI0034532874
MSAAKVVQPSPDFRGLRPLSRGMTFSPRPLNATISRLSSRASLPRQTATMEPSRLSVSSTPLSLSQSSIVLKPGLSVVEIESLLRERVRSKFNDLKLAFQTYDVDQSLSITKGEFRRVLETFCFPLTTDQFDAILAKCQLNPNGTLRYTDFLEKFYGKETSGKDAAKWLSGIHKYNQSRSPMEVSVDKLERELKDKIGANLKNFVKACRLFDYNRDGKIQRHELRKVLENYCFRMTDQQFDKLWHRYDFQHTGVVEYTEFLRRLGVYVHKHNAVAPDSTMLALNWQQVEEERKKQVAKQALQHKSDKVVEGMTFEQIEKELRKKMKSNYANVKKAFLAFDATNSGYISIDDLKSVLVHFTIPMSDQLFSQLMDRLRIKASGKVAWEHFLEKFQDPQADGNGQTIPIKPEANRKVNPIREAEGSPHISDIIEKLRKHILDGYSTIKQAFLVFDDDRDGKVSRKELRKIIESFTFRMSDEQFKELMIILDPLHEGFISYKKFLDLFEPQEKVEAHKWLFSTHKYNAQQPPAILAWDTVEDILREKLTENWNAMLAMYQSFDPDATGTITRRELRRILDNFGLPVSDEHFEKMWRGCQENVHGNIAFGEFLAKLGVDAKPGDLQGLSTQVHEESYAREERRISDQNLRINDIEKNAARRTSKMTADEVILKLQDQMSQKDVQIRKTFLRYNKTGKGRVSKKDFKHILEDNGMFMDPGQFNSLCNRLGFFNGFLQYSDFIAAFEDRRHGGPSSDILRSGNHRVNDTNVRYMSAEEVEELLRTKLREGFNDLPETFLKMDETKSQSITRNDFRKLLDSFMFIMTDDEFNRLMNRLQISKKSKMTFQDFLAKFQETEGPESHPWLNSTHTWNRPNDPAEMACDQVHEILKAKAENAWTDIAKAFKQFDRDGNGIITKKELRNVLFRFTLPLKSSEFNKLWTRYDVDQKGYLTHGEFVEVLGLTFAPGDMHGTSRRIVDDSQAFLDQHHQGQQARHQQIAANQMKAAGHMTAAEVEQQLKDKFREYYQDFDKAFRKVDYNKDGTVDIRELQRVLIEHNFFLEEEQFFELLDRLGLSPEKGKLSYPDFLKAIDDGRASKYGRRRSPVNIEEYDGLPAEKSLEKLREKVASNFVVVEKAFNAFDKESTGKVKASEFRRIIDHFCFRHSDKQFRALLAKLSFHSDNTINWRAFLDDFKKNEQEATQNWLEDIQKAAKPKSPQELAMQEVQARVQEAVSARFYAFARSFAEVDYAKIGVVAKEDFRDILNKNAIRLSDDQFDQLWESMPVNEFGNVVYREFLKQFSVERTRLPDTAPASPPPTAMSETPSAMVFARRPATASTPKSGRMSVMSERPTSRMSRPFTPLVNAQGAELRMKDRVFRHWKDIQRLCKSRDPENKGEIYMEDFKAIVESFNIYLAADDLEQLRIKYDMRNNGRFSYKAFLRHFLLRLKPQQESILQRKKLQTPRFSVKQGAESSLLYDAMLRMRDVIMAEWQRMRRTFRAIDAKGEGFVSPVDFRQVLKEYGINLSEEEFFHLMTFYDKGMVGKISYNDFLRAYLSQ